ncbi:hypothetical protein WA026_000126 [Henosepilachna vigintioctopunctata]|uniref:C2H2-type domain-containing protein n=1 Tax=Henosepilachna vigintioctopunctata TaxID=420089 RepID=A0AAW1V454_9CUCU
MEEADTTLTCPFCCKETFNSIVSFKNHILDMKNKLNCPICETNFDDFNKLISHLECCNLKENIEDNPESTSDMLKNESEDIQEYMSFSNSDNEILEAPEEQNKYFCEICNVNFDEMKNHLVEYHMGEEVVVESQNSEVDVEESDIVGSPDNEAEFPVDVKPKICAKDSEHIFLEQEILDENGTFFTKKLTKIDIVQDNISKKAPILEKIIVSDQVLTVLTDKESEDMENFIKLYRCQDCNLRFAQFGSYTKHVCNWDQYEVCEICSIPFKTKGALTHHKKKLHGIVKVVNEKIPSECDVCHIVFPSSKSMVLHRKMHDLKFKPRTIDPPATYNIIGNKIAEENNESFTCSVCGKAYNKKYEEVHMKSHSEELFNCPICNRKFSDKEDLSMHAQAHGNENHNKVSCRFCKTIFTSKDMLVEHLENQCGGRKYGCSFCGKKFIRPHEKVKHERIHTGQKPHVCEVCGKGFRVSYCLTLHLRTHSGVRPYHCKICGKRFKSYSVFNHHSQTHSDARPYECPFCPKTFKTSVQLAGHKNTHTKPFSCNICNRPFASLYAVRQHQKSHDKSNNLNHECDVCGAVYSRYFALRDHMLSHPKLDNENHKSNVDISLRNVKNKTSSRKKKNLDARLSVKEDESSLESSENVDN